MWFDTANFRRYSVWRACELELNRDIDVNFKPRQVTSTLTMKEPVRICPVCLIGLSKINYGYDSNIIIDKC